MRVEITWGSVVDVFEQLAFELNFSVENYCFAFASHFRLATPISFYENNRFHAQAAVCVCIIIRVDNRTFTSDRYTLFFLIFYFLKVEL